MLHVTIYIMLKMLVIIPQVVASHHWLISWACEPTMLECMKKALKLPNCSTAFTSAVLVQTQSFDQELQQH